MNQHPIIKGGKAYELTVITPQVLRETNFVEPCDSSDKMASYIRENIRLASDMQENFNVIFFNTRRRVIGHQLVGLGILDQVLAHPREIFRAAIVVGAHAICLTHNHPSGDFTPSEADVKVTRDLVRAGQILKIEVLDHIIMGQKNSNGKDFCSLRELGYFCS